MSRTKSLVVAALVILGSTVTGVGVAPAAAQEDEYEDVTVELGVIEGASVCVQQLTSDSNQLIIRNASYEDVTIYLDENRRVELEQTQPDATMVLHTGRQNETLNDLSAVGDCLSTDEMNVVVTAHSVSIQGLSATGYMIEAGPNSDVPEPSGFNAESNSSDEEDDETDGTVIDIGESDGSEEQPVEDGTEPVTETEETVNETLNGTEEVVNDTVDQIDETVNDTVNQTDETVNDTVNQTDETVDNTVDQTDETVDDTVDQTDETVDETTDHVEDSTDDVTETLTETPNETDEQLEETTDETLNHTEETAEDTGDHLEETAEETGTQTDETADDTTDLLHESTEETADLLGL